MTSFDEKLRGIVGADAVHAEEPLAAHTTFEIGGPAQWLVEPATEEQVRAIAALCRAEGVRLQRVSGRCGRARCGAETG